MRSPFTDPAGEQHGQTPAPMGLKERLFWGLVAVLWLAALAVGARVLWNFQVTPGAAATA